MRQSSGSTTGVRFLAESRDFSVLHIVHTGPWTQSSLLSILYLGPCPQRKVAVSWIWRPHVLPKSRVVEMYIHSTICLNGVMFNQLNTRRILSFPSGYSPDTCCSLMLVVGIVSLNKRITISYDHKGLRPFKFPSWDLRVNTTVTSISSQI
jgi:hypothetical protein